MKTIEVWGDWHFLASAKRIGTLTASPSRGKEAFSFEYDPEWLKDKKSLQVDPQLHLFKGRFHPAASTGNFGIFLDSSPDRWGRTLMLRREALSAQKEERKPRSLLESDFLLGVYDPNRLGGIRFRIDGGPYLDDDKSFSTPPWTHIRELEEAIRVLEDDSREESDPKYLETIRLLFAPGSSLGGARPKANILDADQNLWIAKFPSRDDLKDVGAWEGVVHELAVNCGLSAPKARAQKLSGKHHTFLVKRFDRLPGNKRVHFASAMTLLQRQDGDNYLSGTSYLELVDFIITSGAPSKVNRDLEELWRRIVFSIAVSNSDDHLRNHGFILSQDGWELSPAYDINPNETADGLSLNISLDSNVLDFKLAKEVASEFRVKSKRADEIIGHVCSQVSEWKTYANTYSIPRSEQLRVADAFRV